MGHKKVEEHPGNPVNMLKLFKCTFLFNLACQDTINPPPTTKSHILTVLHSHEPSKNVNVNVNGLQVNYHTRQWKTIIKTLTHSKSKIKNVTFWQFQITMNHPMHHIIKSLKINHQQKMPNCNHTCINVPVQFLLFTSSFLFFIAY